MSGQGKSKEEISQNERPYKYSALENLSQRVEERYRNERKKLEELRSKRSTEKAHSQYLQGTYGSSADASSSAAYWASRHGSKRIPSISTTERQQSKPNTSRVTSSAGSLTVSVDERVAAGSSLFDSSIPVASTSSLPAINPFSVMHPSTRSLAQQLELQKMANERKTSAEQISTLSTEYNQHNAERIDLSSPDMANDFGSSPEKDPFSCMGLNCPVINCEVTLISIEARRRHFMRHEHSPCNPARQLRNGSLEVVIDEHGCPVCARVFPNYDECHNHMVEEDHRALMEPVAIACYACPQCMLIFPTQEITQQHMLENTHNKFLYPFKDDVSMSSAAPVPIPTAVYREYVNHCKQVGWHVSCADCDREVSTFSDLMVHVDKKHILMATTESMPDEVWGCFMIKGYTCVQCLRLFDTSQVSDGADGIHNCRHDVMGMFVESTSDCLTLRHYVMRLALSPADGSSPTSAIHIENEDSTDDEAQQAQNISNLVKVALSSTSRSSIASSSIGEGKSATSGTSVSTATSQSASTNQEATTSGTSSSSSTSASASTSNSNYQTAGESRSVSSDVGNQADKRKSPAGRTGFNKALASMRDHATSTSLINAAIETSNQATSTSLTYTTIEKEDHSTNTSLTNTKTEVVEQSTSIDFIPFGNAGAKSNASEMNALDQKSATEKTDDFDASVVIIDESSMEIDKEEEGSEQPSDIEVPMEIKKKKRKARRKNRGKNKRKRSQSSDRPTQEVFEEFQQNLFETFVPSESNSRCDISHSVTRHMDSCKIIGSSPQITNDPPSTSTVEEDITPPSAMPQGLNYWQKLAWQGQKGLPKPQIIQPNRPVSPASLVAGNPDVEIPPTSPDDVELVRVFGKEGVLKEIRDQRSPIIINDSPIPVSDSPNIPESLTKSSLGNVFKPLRLPTVDEFVLPPISHGTNQERESRPVTRNDANRWSPSKGNDLSKKSNSRSTSRNRGKRSRSNSKSRNSPGPTGALSIPVDLDSKPPEGLEKMHHIVFLDLDNWQGFWNRLPGKLPDFTFVWAFHGGATMWSQPGHHVEGYWHAVKNGWFHLHGKCSNRKDAADFAICLWVGKMDERLPKHIPFTVLSGDNGFLELERQMQLSERRAKVINPHHQDNETIYALIASMGET